MQKVIHILLHLWGCLVYAWPLWMWNWHIVFNKLTWEISWNWYQHNFQSNGDGTETCLVDSSCISSGSLLRFRCYNIIIIYYLLLTTLHININTEYYYCIPPWFLFVITAAWLLLAGYGVDIGHDTYSNKHQVEWRWVLFPSWFPRFSSLYLHRDNSYFEWLFTITTVYW